MCEHHKEKLQSRVSIQDNGCWMWTGARITSGYGNIYLDGKVYLTHRVAFELFKRPLIEGEVVRHTCDTPWCVNPKHLIAGTVQDNSDDKVQKGRHSFGSGNGMAKLNEEKVIEIKRLLAGGDMLQYEIAEAYDVDPKIITWIKQGRLWKHVGVTQ